MTPAGRVADSPDWLCLTTMPRTGSGSTMDASRAERPGKLVPPENGQPAFAAVAGWLPVEGTTPEGDELACSEVGVAAEAARVAIDAGLARLRSLLPETGQEMDGNG